MAQANRPLSPHLQIYRWYLAMGLSIAHRASGIMLCAALLLLTWWLAALASGEESFAVIHSLTNNLLGGLILFGVTFVTFYHLCNGIRHLGWDAGFGFEKHQAYQTGLAVVALAAALTIVTWIVILV